MSEIALAINGNKGERASDRLGPVREAQHSPPIGDNPFPPSGLSGDINAGNASMSFDVVEYHVLWTWTNRELDSLAQCVKEGKSLQSARAFCVYLLNSG